MRELLLLAILIYSIHTPVEGFYNSLTNVHQVNNNKDKGYPDTKVFYAVGNDTLSNIANNYKIKENVIKPPQKGTYSSFLDINKIRNYDHFYHAPITDETYTDKIMKYDRSFREDGQNIIQAEDINKSQLYKEEDIQNESSTEAFDLYGYHNNNSKILYSNDIQDKFLMIKNKTLRHADIGVRGAGYSGL